jgi:hypothetical protein
MSSSGEEDLVIVKSANDASGKHAEAPLRQRGQPASAATPAAEAPAAASGTPAPPESKAGSDTPGGRSGTSVKVLLGALIFFAINHVMNDSMDESVMACLACLLAARLAHCRIAASPRLRTGLLGRQPTTYHLPKFWRRVCPLCCRTAG